MTSMDTMAKARANPANTPAAASRQSSSPSKTSNPGQVSHERIARRAYEIWERDGRPEGRCEQHWRAAEEELRRT